VSQIGLVGGWGRKGVCAGGGPGCDVVVDAHLLVKLTFLSKTAKKSPLSPHRTLPRFKHSSSDDRRSKTSLMVDGALNLTCPSLPSCWEQSLTGSKNVAILPGS